VKVDLESQECRYIKRATRKKRIQERNDENKDSALLTYLSSLLNTLKYRVGMKY
jgi:hypothetical protein